jgi:hypothetical protein
VEIMMAFSERESSRRRRRVGTIFGLMVSLLALPTSSRAQTREDGAPAESMGAGDAVRASAWGSAALHYNPAGLMRVPVLVVQGTYSYLEGIDGHNATLSMVDAQTNQHAALGVSYSLISTAPDGRDRDGHQVRSALATGYRSRDFALFAGIGLRWLTLTLGEDDEDSEETDDVDTWLLFDFGSRIRFAVVGQNLIDTRTDQAPRLLGFGFSFLFETLDVGANLDLDVSGRGDTRVSTWGLGADLGVAGAVQLRTGFTRDERLDQERVSFGLGWSNDAVAIDLAYATALSNPSRMVFGVSVRWVP